MLVKVPELIVSKPDAATALAHLSQYLSDSAVIEFLGSGVLKSECGSISTIMAFQPPPNARYDQDIRETKEQAAARYSWITEKIVSHLQGSPTAIVLFEDPLSDPAQASSCGPGFPPQKMPFWDYNGRIFWPVLAKQPDQIGKEIDDAESWVMGFRKIIHFAEAPSSLTPVKEKRSLSPEEFGSIVSSLKSIVIAIYDWSGWMEWQRRVPAGT